jgi:Recombinase
MMACRAGVDRVQSRSLRTGVKETVTWFATPAPMLSTAKAAVLKRLRAMQAEGLSMQAIANRLNKEGVPTLSGKGRWQKGTIGNLLAQADKE